MSKPYITRLGYDLLREELDYLWLELRPQITQKVSWAASLGDRSENADYQYNKRLLFQIDRRVRYLRGRLNTLQVVDFNPSQQGRVYFGAYVEIEDEDGNLMQLRLVGGEELFGRSNYISIDSPMAKALLGKEEGDEAAVKTPKGLKVWYVNKIAYQKPEWFTEEPVRKNNIEVNDEDIKKDLESVEGLDPKVMEQEYLKSLMGEQS